MGSRWFLRGVVNGPTPLLLAHKRNSIPPTCADVLTIETIDPAPKRRRRRLIRFDSGDEVILRTEAIGHEGLAVGSSIEKKILLELVATDQAIQAKEDAASWLSRKQYSVKALSDQLLQSGFPQQVIDPLIADFGRWGYLDDEALARSLVRQLGEGKRFGPARLRQELGRRGIDRDLIDVVISTDTSDMQERAIDALTKKDASYRRLDRERAQRRMHGYLARRGFDGQTIRSAIDHVLDSWKST